MQRVRRDAWQPCEPEHALPVVRCHGTVVPLAAARGAAGVGRRLLRVLDVRHFSTAVITTNPSRLERHNAAD